VTGILHGSCLNRLSSELHRLRGELFSIRKSEAEPEASMRIAVEISRQQNAKIFELRDVLALNRLLSGSARKRAAGNAPGSLRLVQRRFRHFGFERSKTRT